MKLSALLTTAVALTVVNARAVETRDDNDKMEKMNNTKEMDGNNADIYPAPMANGGKSWGDAYKKASDIVGQMTVEEKTAIITSAPGRCVGTTQAVERLGIPRLCMMDGPTGPRPVKGISQSTSGQTAAATWDRDLIYQRSKDMGQEFFDLGVNVALAPVASGPIGRSPLGGRNWEGSYPDPYANGQFSRLSVQGLQDSHVAATTKHWIMYEQETFRHPYNTSQPDNIYPLLTQEPVSSNVDDYTTHMLYMPPFAEAIRAGSGHVMCSYNQINGTQACNDAHSQNHLLKTELGFQGSVISDWGGVHDTAASIRSGMDVSTPGVDDVGYSMGTFYKDLDKLVNNGTVAEDRLSDAAIRFLTPYYWLGQDSEHTPPEVTFDAASGLDLESEYKNVRKEGTAELIRKIGTDSTTLLKNTGGLPLNRPQRLVLLGSDIGSNVLGPDGCGDDRTKCPMGNFNGTISVGGGSGSTIPPYVVSPLEAIRERVEKDGTEISYAMKYDEDHINKISSRADATVVFVNNWAEESKDRHNIDLDEEQAMILDAAVKASSNVIIVMHTPGVVNMEKWTDNDNVTAIVEAYYPGQETGDAVVPILYGERSPSGKLPFTWGKSLSDYPPNTISTDDSMTPQADFSEGVYIDYRWFDKKEIEPRWEFGFGLSYTTFEFSDISVEENYKKDENEVQATNEPFEGSDGTNSLYDTIKTVKATVTNTGDVEGCEVVQLYVTFPGDNMPVRELRGFEKVKDLKSNESKQVEMDLRLKDLSVWDVERQTWVMPSGEFKLSVGSSSRQLPLHTTCTN
ncbi:hypothetical protein E3P94_03882 [Wallemia ichthyophaga]|nr:hypothetical protein E3P95_03886 [Wallemia ichthyophaga]TIA95930.1 hypothetical protein E3P94_03882 [Wallemia ichthyophaga]